jgi:hypothetical protein
MKKILVPLMTFAILISVNYVQAGQPTSDEDHIYPWAMNVSDQTEFYAVGTGYTNGATQAFHFLQDTLGKPHVRKVEFNWGHGPLLLDWTANRQTYVGANAPIRSGGYRALASNTAMNRLWPFR